MNNIESSAYFTAIFDLLPSLYYQKSLLIGESPATAYYWTSFFFSNSGKPFLKEIHSGGQTDADEAALKAAHDIGIPTRGIAPKSYRVQLADGTDSTNPELDTKYGLVEHESPDYPPRTKENVANTDGTVWFGFADSPGGKLTIGTCQKLNKPYLLNPTSQELREWVLEKSIEKLNVAGNRVNDFNPDIFETTYQIIYKAFKP